MSWFSRLTLQARSREELKRLNALREHPYAQHQALWRLFDKPAGTEQPFLFRKMNDETHDPVLRFLLLSDEQPQSGIDGWQVESKPYLPQLQEGERFHFSIRLNPTRSERTIQQDSKPDGKRPRGKRQDYVMSRLQQLQTPTEQRAAERQRIVHEELPQWLASKASRRGFTIDTCVVERFALERMRITQRKDATKHDVTLSVADFSGTLCVADAVQLRQVLLQGLGHGRAFGMGLMLLKPR